MGGAVLRVRLLGAVEVDVDGTPVTSLGPPKQRALLAALALSPGRVVPAHALVAALWDDPPPSAPAVLQTYVSALRRVLEPARAADQRWQVLLTRRPGYLLDVRPGDVDSERFAASVTAARQARAAGWLELAVQHLRAADAEWRGPPLADVGDAPVASSTGTALSALRVDALEERLEAQLLLGGGGELVPDLERLVAAHPLRESARGHLMLALYRAGRQADALRTYELGRRLLADELGMDPSPALRGLFAAVLRQDASLDAAREPGPLRGGAPPGAPARPAPTSRPGPSGTPAEAAPPPAAPLPAATAAAPAPLPSAAPQPPARGRRARLRTAALVAVVVLLGALAVQQSRPANAQALRPGAVGLVDLRTGDVQDQVDLGERPSALVVADGRLWAPLPRRGVLASTDAAAPAVVREATLEPGVGGAAAADGALWVAQTDARVVARVDGRSRRVVQRVPVGGRPQAVAAAGGSVWVANRLDDTVSRIDPRAGRVLATVAVGRDPVGLSPGDEALWVVAAGDATLTRISLGSGVPRRFRLAGTPGDVLVAHGVVWVSDAAAGTVSRVDEQTGQVLATMPVGSGAGELAALQDAVVVGSAYAGWLAVLDPVTGAVRERHQVASGPLAVHSDGRRLWAGAAAGPGAAGRGGTLRVALGGPLESPDPTEATTGAVTSLTHDGLVSVRRAAGADGAQLVPGLAGELPVPTGGGRTWTFRLRPGIAWSSGGSVRPADVRASFERLVQHGVPYFSAIRGARACTAARCDLSAGITLDEVDETVSFHLEAPDPDFLARLALPQAAVLPADSPAPVLAEQAADVDWSRLGATGPYRVSRVDASGRVLLVRNERFAQWSQEAAPDGLADQIEVQYSTDTATAVDDVLAGRLDAVLDPPPERVEELARRFPGQLLRVDEPATYRLVLNHRRLPFSQPDARRAVAMAVDRRALAASLGGGLLGSASCQVLPPVVLGYAPYCPHGERPDLGTARRLVQRSGTTGQVVRLYAHPPRADLARQLERTLDAIGYDAQLTVVQGDYFRLVADSRTTPEAHVAGWYAETPSATSFALLARCASHVERADNNTSLNVAGYCDARAEQLIDDALRTQQSDPSGAAAAWRAVDRHLTDTLAWVPLASLQRAVLVRQGRPAPVFVPVVGPALELMPAR